MAALIQHKYDYIPLESFKSFKSNESTTTISSTVTAPDPIKLQSQSLTNITSPPPEYSHIFSPTQVLLVQAHGQSHFSFPCSLKELETPIFNPTTGRPVYISIRYKRGSGSCRLVRAEDENEATIAETTYRFGPMRDPVVSILAGAEVEDAKNAADELESFEVKNESVLSRACRFETTRWGVWEWRYGSKKERQAYAADSLLILERILKDHKGRSEKVRVAQLVRGEGTRTAGSTKCSAGNGGTLQIDGRVTDGAMEILIVTTCLMMLKKEIDRSRGIKIGLMVSFSAGGS